MMPALLQLLRCLEQILDPARQNRIAELFADTLNWRPVKRLPLVLTYGHVLDRFPTGVTLVHHAESLKKAQQIIIAYKRAAENRGPAYD